MKLRMHGVLNVSNLVVRIFAAWVLYVMCIEFCSML